MDATEGRRGGSARLTDEIRLDPHWPDVGSCWARPEKGELREVFFPFFFPFFNRQITSYAGCCWADDERDRRGKQWWL